MAGHAKTLNPRQMAFAQALVGPDGQGMSYKDAALKAGYKNGSSLDRYAPRIAQTPIVKAEIQRLRNLARATRELTAEEWRRELSYQYARLKDDKPAGDALRALELWGKHLGLLDTRAASGDVELAARLLVLLAQAGRAELPSRARALIEVEGRVVDEAAGL